MGEVSIMRIDRKSSIETEPRTLNFRQIQSARDAALYVLNTMTIEDASQIFTQGMEPITMVTSRDTYAASMGDYLDEENKLYPSYNNQQFRMEALREVLTAPF
ncbi:uncharacterized protein LOC130828410 [Amaranthus tricolor]|uniref:uncharacterized protein LOC130828410 n=1 Tax=Amaranthus tricolor TaxID=29722 RepID=UPI00258EF180|nr:uncharacterized protein LOC130828410 [Amaranthus tricolor]